MGPGITHAGGTFHSLRSGELTIIRRGQINSCRWPTICHVRTPFACERGADNLDERRETWRLGVDEVPSSTYRMHYCKQAAQPALQTLAFQILLVICFVYSTTSGHTHESHKFTLRKTRDRCVARMLSHIWLGHIVP